MTDHSVGPNRIPETRPTPLQQWFIYLSIVVLACGAFAITALSAGVSPREPLVKLPVVVAAAVMVLVAGDAIVRIWRSAEAWRAVDNGRALFRYVWIAAIVAGLGLLAGFALPLLAA